MNYKETIEYLFALQWHGIKLGLDNPTRLLAAMDNPHHAFRSAHVAGTNGKGSTAAILSSLLQFSGNKTGLFTSPHMLSFTERISIDTRQISQSDVVRLADEIARASAGLQPTFFEVVTIMGFCYFREHGVDWGVIETGMGGRLDATNVLKSDVALITPVSMDHREFLGDTIAAVAGEKAGIIKPDTPLVLARQLPEAQEVILRQARLLSAPVSLEGEHFSVSHIEQEPQGIRFDFESNTLSLRGLTLPLAGEYQAQNAGLALRAFDIIQAKSAPAIEIAEMETLIRRGLSAVRWPGRFERVHESPPVYIDGAHNAAATEALARTIALRALQGKFTLVLGVMQDKDVRGVIAPLLPLAAEVIFTRAAYGRAAKPKDLCALAAAAGYASTAIEGVAEALRHAMRLGRPVLVTGSFYAIGEALEALGQESVFGTLRESPPLSPKDGSDA